VSWSRIDLVRASRITLSPKSNTSRSRIRVSGCTRSSSRRGWGTPRPGTVASCAPKVRVRDMDVPGTVEAVGQNVTQFQTGDEVFGTCDGSFAEYAFTPQDMVALKPGDLTFEQAAVPTSLRSPGTARRRQHQVRPAGLDCRVVRRRRAVRTADVVRSRCPIGDPSAGRHLRPAKSSLSCAPERSSGDK
jgi:hypothetical protein